MARKFTKYPKNYVRASSDLDWYSEMRNDIEDGSIDGLLAYDSKYAGKFNSIYEETVEDLSKKYPGLFMEPSVQLGRGSTFVSFEDENGEEVTGDWDFADECDAIEELASECETLPDFKLALYKYYDAKLSKIAEGAK